MSENVTQKVFDDTINRVDKGVDRFKDDVKGDMTIIFEDLKSLRNRLPVWATLLIGLLAGALGWAVKN